MFTIIFILMLLFLAHASLITLSHLFLNEFVTEHRDIQLTRNVIVTFAKGSKLVTLEPNFLQTFC